MRARTIGALTILIVLVGVGWLLTRQSKTEATDSVQTSTETADSTQGPVPRVEEQPSSPAAVESEPKVNAAVPPPVQSGPPITSLAPKREELRAQVKANPHQPPEAMLAFTAELYERRVRALESEELAKDYFKELQNCARDNASPANAQAMCLVNARYLKIKYSSLAPSYEQLEREANPDTLRFLKNVRPPKVAK